MAKINICDICKTPGDTNFRLILFKLNGKKREDKLSKEICITCNESLRGSRKIPTAKEIFEAVRTAKESEIEEDSRPPQIQDGVFKVSSRADLKKLRREEKEKDSQCSHDNKTIDDNEKLACRDCGKLINE